MKLSAPIHQLKRRAKAVSRDEGVPLHAALDGVAAAEGLSSWSLLAARHAEMSVAARLYATLADGDMVLIGARPGQGKTLVALELAIEAIRSGRQAAFFSLEYTEDEARDRLGRLGNLPAGFDTRFTLDCSDAISDGHIVARMADAPKGSLAVIDYLQLLDQRRDTPPLDEQVRTLAAFAQRSGVTLAFISQIDRSYDPALKPVPDLADIRLPNPLDLGLFTRTCFLHGGEMRFAAS
jgi:hypothetical protein